MQDEDTDEKSEAEAFAAHRAHARLPHGAQTAPEAKIDYGKAAKHFLREDLAQIETTIRASAGRGEGAKVVARRVVGSAGLGGVDGVTETTRHKIARFGLTAIRRLRKKR
jgi:hypothetical protein